jgi:hypothetical protein
MVSVATTVRFDRPPPCSAQCVRGNGALDMTDTTTTIAAEAERARDHALPGREAVEVNALRWAAWRMIRTERRAVRDQRRRAISVRIPRGR